MFNRLKRIVAVLWTVTVAGLLSGPGAATDAPLRLGDNRLDTQVGDMTLEVFTYRPLHCAQPSVLVVLHGNGRGASSYRNSAKPVAEQSCFVVYSPLFDRDRFPSWSYHRGGLFEDGELRDDEDWTVNAVDDMVDWIRRREGGDTPVYLFGHSAGAQYLSRVAAYAPPANVERIVLANPSTYVMPARDWAAPYGFGGLPDALSSDAAILAYLAAPVTIYLGQEDTGEEDLTRGELPDRQGDNRLDRGRRAFEYARSVAEQNGWPFGWTLIEAPGIGHTARGMLGADQLVEALGFGVSREEAAGR